MGLITRCPGCGTMFKVVPDQLKISEGWVRCGHCSDVFDASAHLQPADAVAAASIDPHHERLAAAESPAEPSESELESDADSDARISSLHSEIEESAPAEAPDSAQLDAEAQELIENPLDRPFALRREDLSAPGELMPREPQEPADSDLPHAPPFQELTFVRQARRQALWQRPAVRVLMLLAALALGLLLAGQVAIQERDRLAAYEPALRPWLVRLCEPFDCRIRAPRQIDAIAIDNSSFNKLRPDAYRLQVTLKNQGATEVAMPALELTLTDSQEQPVIRRVLLPGDVVPPRATIAAASEWSGSVAIALVDSSLGGRIAGY